MEDVASSFRGHRIIKSCCIYMAKSTERLHDQISWATPNELDRMSYLPSAETRELEFINKFAVAPKDLAANSCMCGATKCKSTSHSHWCPRASFDHLKAPILIPR